MTFRVFLGATGGVVEEILYRGYAIERLVRVTGSRWFGTTAAVLAFALSHIPEWGVGFALTADLFAGVVLALFYLWRRDLVANMLAHSTGLIVAMFTMVPPAASPAAQPRATRLGRKAGLALRTLRSGSCANQAARPRTW